MDAGLQPSPVDDKLRRLAFLLDVGKSIVAHRNLRELISVISDYLQQVINCDGIWVTVLDTDSGKLRVFALDPIFQGNPTAGEGELVPMEGTPSERVMKSQQTIIVSRQMLENSSSVVARSVAAGGMQSGCIAPLVSQGRAIGTLAMVSKVVNAFSEEDAELFTHIAGQIAVAVDNAMNFERARAAEEQAQRQSKRLQLLLDINNAVVSNLNLPDLLVAISTGLRRVLSHDFTGMALYDAEANQLRVQALDSQRNQELFGKNDLIPLKGTGAGKAFTSRKPVLIRSFEANPDSTEMVRLMASAGFKSGCHVPLITRDKVLGTLDVLSFRADGFTEEDAELLMQIGQQIAIAVDNALVYREIEAIKNKLAEEKLYLEEEIQTAWNFERIIGASASLQRILKQVETVAPTDSTVLIRGETGTGKELIARAIHNLSERRERSLVKLNCAAIPMGLLESELFGHEKGAFTGAISQRIGRFELANKGTLFLDEVGDIPLELQPKLLRVLQEQEFERLGSTRTQRVDVRLVAATNCNLEQMVADKQYRGDLFYRLNVFPILLPPLRERREDIPLLARFFAQKFAQRMHKQLETIPAETMAALTQYHWPGNIRELENVIERAVILSRGPALEVPLHEMKPAKKAADGTATSANATLADNEREHILRVLEETGWVISGPNGAATRLGVKRTTLQARMQKLGISRQR
ncbi:MAG: sigma 54-interacting transcriptional regulator [Acidobacteria bacterium]|nr:sigma 54-interacting transcriptional regulator [Acidobacteriota bacterium]